MSFVKSNLFSPILVVCMVVLLFVATNKIDVLTQQVKQLSHSSEAVQYITVPTTVGEQVLVQYQDDRGYMQKLEPTTKGRDVWIYKLVPGQNANVTKDGVTVRFTQFINR